MNALRDPRTRLATSAVSQATSLVTAKTLLRRALDVVAEDSNLVADPRSATRYVGQAEFGGINANHSTLQCSKIGHIARNCPEAGGYGGGFGGNQGGYGGGAGGYGGGRGGQTCYSCGGYGHMSRTSRPSSDFPLLTGSR